MEAENYTGVPYRIGMVNPCGDCKGRSASCHQHCLWYIRWRRRLDFEKEKKRKFNNRLYEFTRSRMDNRKRRRYEREKKR